MKFISLSIWIFCEKNSLLFEIQATYHQKISTFPSTLDKNPRTVPGWHNLAIWKLKNNIKNFSGKFLFRFHKSKIISLKLWYIHNSRPVPYYWKLRKQSILLNWAEYKYLTSPKHQDRCRNQNLQNFQGFALTSL